MSFTYQQIQNSVDALCPAIQNQLFAIPFVGLIASAFAQIVCILLQAVVGLGPEFFQAIGISPS